MFDDLPPDLERLLTLRVWHAMWLERIDRKIAAVEQRQAEAERGRRMRPAPPDWVAAFGIGAGRETAEVHAGGCHRSNTAMPAAMAASTTSAIVHRRVVSGLTSSCTVGDEASRF